MLWFDVKENQREGGQYQSVDLNKEKSPVGKTQLPEITKKGQVCVNHLLKLTPSEQSGFVSVK